MRKIKVNEYEIIEDLYNGEFKCLRNGKEWRDLAGDNMVMAMFDRIDELEKILNNERCGFIMLEQAIEETFGIEGSGKVYENFHKSRGY